MFTLAKVTVRLYLMLFSMYLLCVILPRSERGQTVTKGEGNRHWLSARTVPFHSTHSQDWHYYPEWQQTPATQTRSSKMR
jgi:hypothetical protein